MLKLVKPSIGYKDSYLKAWEEFKKEGRLDEISWIEGEDFEEYIKRLLGYEDGDRVPAHWVPSTTFWLVDGEEYLGRISLRHYLTEDLLKVGGNIGYEIRPSKRGKGYGTEMLRLVLEKAKEKGFDKVLITCDSTNTASKKVIENNKGELENTFIPENGVAKLRYWINLNG